MQMRVLTTFVVLAATSTSKAVSAFDLHELSPGISIKNFIGGRGEETAATEDLGPRIEPAHCKMLKSAFKHLHLPGLLEDPLMLNVESRPFAFDALFDVMDNAMGNLPLLLDLGFPSSETLPPLDLVEELAKSVAHRSMGNETADDVDVNELASRLADRFDDGNTDGEVVVDVVFDVGDGVHAPKVAHAVRRIAPHIPIITNTDKEGVEILHVDEPEEAVAAARRLLGQP